MEKVSKPEMLTIEKAESLTMNEGLAYFKRHISPGIGKAYEVLGLATRRPVRAVGSWIYMDDGSKVLDFTAGLAVLNVGHNHPRIIAARHKWASEQRLEVWKFIPSPYQAALAKNLASVFPRDLELVFFCNSGAEANEGALKMASKYAGPGRDLVVYTDISFHGKTHATLSVSGSESNQSRHFKLLDGCISIPYGDASSLERIVRANKGLVGKSKVATFIVEAIRSEGVVVPPKGYLQEVRAICSHYDVVLVVDEVFCGFGRTGKMFAFEHEGIVPDIVSFSKAFGGGKATFAGYIARPSIYKKAYGTLREATLHSTTYSGFGEEVVAAIEALHILYDEDLVANSARNGAYLLERLREVERSNRSIVSEVRGVGLLACIRLRNLATRIAGLIPGAAMPEEVLSKVTTGGVISELYEKHNILTYTPLHDPNQLLLTPSLIVTQEEIDRFIKALDSVLKTNLVETGMRYLKKLLAD